MDTNPCCCSSAFSKCPPLFPVVKLCLSKLQKPSPAPAQPRCAVPEVIFIPLPAWCHPLPSVPPFPPALPAHTHTHTSVLQSRQSHFLPSAREEQGSVPGGVSVPRAEPPAPANFSLIAPSCSSGQPLPCLARPQLPCRQTRLSSGIRHLLRGRACPAEPPGAPKHLGAAAGEGQQRCGRPPWWKGSGV